MKVTLQRIAHALLSIVLLPLVAVVHLASSVTWRLGNWLFHLGARAFEGERLGNQRAWLGRLWLWEMSLSLYVRAFSNLLIAQCADTAELMCMWSDSLDRTPQSHGD